jgi:hypothetical protein
LLDILIGWEHFWRRLGAIDNPLYQNRCEQGQFRLSGANGGPQMIKADEMLTNIYGDLKNRADPKLKRGVLKEEVSRSFYTEVSILSFERE